MKCPNCSKLLAIRSEHEGKKVKCPGCKTAFVVPLSPVIAPRLQPVTTDTAPRFPIGNSSKPVVHEVSRTNDVGKSWLSQYIEWCGIRSFVFQAILLAWTVFMCIVGFGLLLSASTTSKTSINSPIQAERDGAAVAVMLVGLCCPLGTFLLLAIPLGIAVIATFESKKHSQ